MSLTKLISHRGNLVGPEPSQENKPSTILKAINNGFDCEIDIWLINEELFLGHDEPLDKTSLNFLSQIQEFIWIHCKNFEALEYFNLTNKFNYFWHEDDRFTITSSGIIWTYPGNVVGENSVIVDNDNKITEYNCYGVCSDYISLYK
tara:strand:- start:2628 stop:3068 length:441 start_codon:yes stop_codon:yes gene_type:complete